MVFKIASLYTNTGDITHEKNKIEFVLFGELSAFWWNWISISA
jgi:hypothetical protein